MDLTQLIEEVRVLQYSIAELAALTKHERIKNKMFGEWISEKEAMQLTGLSRSSLFTLTKQGKLIKSSIAGKKNYYKLSDFKRILDENQYL